MASRRKIIKPHQDAERYINLKADKSGLEKRFIDDGRGVFATSAFYQGDFVLEYRGRLLPCEHVSRKAVSEFVFDFKWKGQCWSLDASVEDESLGRLVNDDHQRPNCKMKIVDFNREPHLCMFALRDISPGEELSCNYGDADWPRLKQVMGEATITTAEHALADSEKNPLAAGEWMKNKDKHSVVDDHDGAVSRTPVMMKKSEVQIELSVAELPMTHQSVMSGKAPSQETTEKLKERKSLPNEDSSEIKDCESQQKTRKRKTITPLMESSDESEYSDYSDVDYMPDTEGSISDSNESSADPLLLKPSMISSLELVVENREMCGVPRENPFLFARSGALTAYRGGKCIHKYAAECGAQHPEALTSTRLRKLIATMFQILNLEGNEADQLADFLGHDICVHRQYYRLPQGTLQLAKMSKLLMAMEKGTICRFKGKSLDDIEVHPEEQCDDQSDGDDDDDELDGPPSSTTSSPTAQPHASPVAAKVHEIASPVKAFTSRHDSTAKPRRKWETVEVAAIERHMMHFIHTGRVPQKRDCDKCITAEQHALGARSWTDVKNYVRNRSITLRRSSTLCLKSSC
ncbi:hypothetical protein ACEWY4_027965 [Coilia grayii]|uniref:SET domain-containing protein n=1 Tax=Coilia grayii TaxID=363190 RepID=A0ABD1INQ1_9TELE